MGRGAVSELSCLVVTLFLVYLYTRREMRMAGEERAETV